MNTNGLDWVAILLAVFGAVAWGILGLTGLLGDPVNVVELALEPIFRTGPARTIENIIYVLVGLSGIYLLYTASKMGRASRRATRERRRDDATRSEVTRADTATRERENTTDNTDS
ncbi:DUF378 domain-containing protein [Halorussus amylolyticus]|uniref:DUF378 domain-containing protein n=1 Tax=Halorussus amylolyticus TaxID=1126242 RepID=UPI0010510E13|nr:DUF378 domain-containing protein [Halorussus amylolyticus]